MNIIKMFCWRITKYNPQYRNDKGYYLLDEWIDYSDIGQIFAKKEFTLEEYEKVESAYIKAILLFMDCLKIDALKLSGLEKNGKNSKKFRLGNVEIRNNQKYDKKLLFLIIQSILRNKFWGKLEADSMFVHFGWDYYMYIGSSKSCKNSIEKIKQLGLFVEEFESPYLPEEEIELNK